MEWKGVKCGKSLWPVKITCPKDKCKILPVSIAKEDVGDSARTSFVRLKEHDVIRRKTS